MSGTTRRERRRTMGRIAIGLAALAVALGGCGAGRSGSGSSQQPVATPTEGEATLLAGLRLDLNGRCQPIRAGLPATAIAGLDCIPEDSSIASARIYLFNRASEMLGAYAAILDANGIALRVDRPGLSTSEGSYWPGPDTEAEPSEGRNARWLDDDGRGHYLATVVPYVVLDVAGTDANVDALYAWTWRGNMDVPGDPTLWRDGTPVDPNAKG